MENRTTVIIRDKDGQESVFECDTAIVLTLNDMMEKMKNGDSEIHSNVAYIGWQVPEALFAEGVAEMIVNAVKTNYGEEGPLKSGYILFDIAEKLKEKSSEIASSCSVEEVKDYARDTLEGILDDIFSSEGDENEE